MDVWPSLGYCAAMASEHRVELDDYQDPFQPYETTVLCKTKPNVINERGW